MQTSPTKVRVLAEHSRQVSMSLHLLIVGTTVCMRTNKVSHAISWNLSFMALRFHGMPQCQSTLLTTYAVQCTAQSPEVSHMLHLHAK